MPPPLELLLLISLVFFPVALSSWIASRLQWVTPAYFLAWVLNVLFSYGLARIKLNILPSVRPTHELGLELIYWTFTGVMFGFCSGSVAILIIEDRRKQRAKAREIEDQVELK